MADDDTNLEGGCSCGAVRYNVNAPPLIVHCCHCTWCQRETGSAFAVNALVESANVALLSGEPEGILTPSASGKGQTIVRCPTCRVAVWSHYRGLGDKVSFIRVGTLDAGHGLEPDVHIYTSTKQPWVIIPPGAATADEYYETKKTWRPESLARLKAVLQS